MSYAQSRHRRWRFSPSRPFAGALIPAIVSILGLAGSAIAQTPEYRAQWADVFNTGFLTPSQTTTTIANLRTANSNVFIPEVRIHSDAAFIPRAVHYPSLGETGVIHSSGVPMQIDLRSEPEPLRGPFVGYDALADSIAKAHATAEPLEVWAWLVAFRTGAVMRDRHPEWLTWRMVDGALQVDTVDFDPGHPGVEQQLVNVCMDIVTNYDVDGLNFDYIRFTHSANGYNPVSVARFNARYGRTGTPANNDAVWQQWRRDQVTNVIRKIYLNVIAVRPDVRISADTITWAPGPNRPASNDPNPQATWKTNFQNTSAAYRSVYQDWRSWMEEGIIDIALPMNYFRECTHQADYDKWSDFTKEIQFGRQGMIGPGTYLNSLDGALDQLRRSRDPSLPNGVLGAGQSIYSYASPYADTCGGTIQKDPAGMAAALSGGTATRPTALYPTPAPLPDLPRLTNGKGHLMGTVTRLDSAAPGWVDGGQVNINGPVNRTVRTDGTGFYGFVDLPPGEYVVTGRATGLADTIHTVTVTAHAVTTRDIVLAPGVYAESLEFQVSPGAAPAGQPLDPQPVVRVLNNHGQIDTGYSGAVTLALKPGIGANGAALVGTAAVNAVEGVATFSDLGVDRAGAGYVLVASGGSLTAAESLAFDVLPKPTDTFQWAAVVPHPIDGMPSLSGMGVNRNPASPYYGYLYLTDRLTGSNRVHIARPEPAGAGTSATQYVQTGLRIQMGDTGLTPWDVAVGPDGVVWIADIGGRRIYSAPPVPPEGQLSVSPTQQLDLGAVSASGGPRGLTVLGPVTDARVYVAWFTDSRGQIASVQAPDASTPGTSDIPWSGTLGFVSGPYGVAVDTAGNAHYPRPYGGGAMNTAFLKFGPDGSAQPFTAAFPAWVTPGMSLQDAAFVADPTAPGGGYLYYSARVTIGGFNWVIVHRFAMDGTWLDGFGPALAGAPSTYVPIDIPASSTSTVAYIDADDRGNVYVLGMDGGANAVIKVARIPPVGLEDARRAILIGAGLAEATAWDMARLNVADPAAGRVDLADAVAIARSAAGLETTP